MKQSHDDTLWLLEILSQEQDSFMKQAMHEQFALSLSLDRMATGIHVRLEAYKSNYMDIWQSLTFSSNQEWSSTRPISS